MSGAEVDDRSTTKTGLTRRGRRLILRDLPRQGRVYSVTIRDLRHAWEDWRADRRGRG